MATTTNRWRPVPVAADVRRDWNDPDAAYTCTQDASLRVAHVADLAGCCCVLHRTRRAAERCSRAMNRHAEKHGW